GQWARGEWAPPVGFVRFGSLRRLSPISREYGFDRGRPIDRHYIETFLARHAVDVAGDVLEIKDDGYTRRFGAGRVVRLRDRHADAPADLRRTERARDDPSRLEAGRRAARDGAGHEPDEPA